MPFGRLLCKDLRQEHFLKGDGKSKNSYTSVFFTVAEVYVGHVETLMIKKKKKTSRLKF